MKNTMNKNNRLEKEIQRIEAAATKRIAFLRALAEEKISDAKLAKKFGYSTHSARTYRALFTANHSTRGPKRRFDYSKLNWSLSNAENARRFGVSPSRICQLRRELKGGDAR